MKIVEFKARGVDGLMEAVEIAADGKNVVLSGSNGLGKSRVLRLIEKILVGGDLELAPGAEAGEVSATLGDITVTKKVSKSGKNTLSVAKDGFAAKAPATYLKEIIGPISIDPLAFTGLSEKDQLEFLFKIVPNLKEGLAKNDTEMTGVKEKRSGILALLNKAKHDFDSMPNHPDAKRTDIAELQEKYKAGEAQNREREIGLAKIKEIETACEQGDAEVIKIRETIETLKKRIAELEECASKIAIQKSENEAKIRDIQTTLPPAADLSGILAEGQRINEENKKVDANEARDAKAQEVEKYSAQYYTDSLKEMRAIEDARVKIFEDAHMPVKGLTVKDGKLFWLDKPVATLSTGERCRIGAQIAVAQNPKARVILCDDASLYDQTTIGILEEVCSDFQIWRVVNTEEKVMKITIQEGAANAEESGESNDGAGVEASAIPANGEAEQVPEQKG